MTDDKNQHSRKMFALTKKGVMLGLHDGPGAAAKAVERHSGIENKGGIKGQVIESISKLEAGESIYCGGVRCMRVQDSHEPGVIDPSKLARSNPISDDEA